MKRSSSIMSRISGKKSRRKRASQSVPAKGELGKLQMTLRYSFQVNHLMVTVNQAEKLQSQNEEGTADPYVKVKLLFEGSKKEKRKTGIAVENLNPVYDETFEFDFHHTAMKQYSLLVTVKDGANYGLFSKAPILGTFSYPLKDFDKHETSTLWFELEPSH
jgi:Ca2+-dependent lipid-binding protein